MASEMVRRWVFTLPRDSARLARLEAHHPFESILEDAKHQLKILCCHRGQIGGTDFKRVAYCISVGSDTFDLFFNSWMGYRAAYYRSPFEGLAANQRALEVLLPMLLTAGESERSALGRAFIEESLTIPSAKMWLAEKGKEVVRDCPGCTGEWSAPRDDELDPELLNGRWELREELPARWGSKAPYLTKLRILGAFLDSNHNEFIPAVKRFPDGRSAVPSAAMEAFNFC